MEIVEIETCDSYLRPFSSLVASDSQRCASFCVDNHVIMFIFRFDYFNSFSQKDLALCCYKKKKKKKKKASGNEREATLGV